MENPTSIHPTTNDEYSSPSGGDGEAEALGRPNNPLNINVLFVASEAEPFVKIGGLADVAGSLPTALRRIKPSASSDITKIDARLAIPFHPQIRQKHYKPEQVAEFPVQTMDGEIVAKIFSLEENGLPVYLVGGKPIDDESGVYSADLGADGYKYVFFSMAVLELARHLGWVPDILHANDWHTAPAVYGLVRRRNIDPFFRHTATLLTVHNLPYLGSMTAPALEAFGLPPADHADLPAWARDMALPLGLLAADAVVAVSPGYAREILTEEYGSGLHGFLKAHSGKITGILNGLDTTKWDPTNDREIASNFSQANLSTRNANKAFLQEQMGLEMNPGIPLLAMVTRMDPQKGVDIAVDALRTILKSSVPGVHPLQMIFLGTGNPALETEVRKLEADYANSVRARISFNEKLSHHIYAGADMLLMPSRYEPCGLSQMIAMHYGCVPIARATGGLCDTIKDPIETELSTGFLFSPPKAEALVTAIRTAMDIYTNEPTSWQGMQQRGMQQDFSWDRSAQAYLKHYKMLVDRIKV